MTDCYLLPLGKKESLPKISTLQDLEHWVAKTAMMLKKHKTAIHLTENLEGSASPVSFLNIPLIK